MIGLGPGERDQLTPRAVAELRRAAVVVGSAAALAQIADLLLPGTRRTTPPAGTGTPSGTAERDRAAAAGHARSACAVGLARQGYAVALIGTGDAGEYAGQVAPGAGFDLLHVPGLPTSGAPTPGPPVPGPSAPELSVPELSVPELSATRPPVPEPPVSEPAGPGPGRPRASRTGPSHSSEPRRSNTVTSTIDQPVPAAPGAGDTGTAEPGPDLRHHGDAEVRTPGLVDLAVNVRAGTPPDWLREHLAATIAALAAYPEPSAARAAVAARHGRPEDEVLLTAGAAEAFVLLARVLTPRQAVVVHPQFTEPEAALRDAGHQVGRVVLTSRDGFRLTPGAVPENADLVVVGNPTNPTSVLHPAAALTALARPGRTLVVDEAFIDTVPGEQESLATPRDLPGQVVVLRSLTKTWGLAGLRIGYVLGPAPLIAALAAAQPLWPVSTPALAAAEACSAPAALAEAEQAAATTALQRTHLLKGLAALPGVRVHGEAAASFLLVELPDAAAVRLRLRDAGFAVRRGDTFPGLGPNWLRIAVRDEGTTDRFLAALASVLA
ncbi:Rv2231c family pyridoxal phosphate-dependent protein CobC [Kitasatospora sp. NBC_00240]|uniref:Rv2231c family pyridoxal phosphate-dependent protein CobC n=1 Tax=Kitasatospora sp. NBC_00240 TaxID=2903567 RepID=UPI00224D4A05|nr:Rv2231c family pyridoxal phosphate-dependent protein CobC [Kitasatospora sp. NBC_00240]MCX5210238.1 Rv2231c family pyridoxal phosphate-dependent protein CobC [Kitasatospora sp. NBC_00240]